MRTSHWVCAVKGELHVVLCGDAKYAPDVIYERLVAARPATHRHMVHLRAEDRASGLGKGPGRAQWLPRFTSTLPRINIHMPQMLACQRRERARRGITQQLQK